MRCRALLCVRAVLHAALRCTARSPPSSPHAAPLPRTQQIWSPSPLHIPPPSQPAAPGQHTSSQPPLAPSPGTAAWHKRGAAWSGSGARQRGPGHPAPGRCGTRAVHKEQLTVGSLFSLSLHGAATYCRTVQPSLYEPRAPPVLGETIRLYSPSFPLRFCLLPQARITLVSVLLRTL